MSKRRPVIFDDDNPEWTAEDFARARPASELPPEILAQFRNMRGRPPKDEAQKKVAVSIRLSPDVLAHFKCGGPGWQSRIDEALRRVVKRARKSA